jgi:hypothetical protein
VEDGIPAQINGAASRHGLISVTGPPAPTRESSRTVAQLSRCTPPDGHPQKAIPKLPKGLLNKAKKETIVIDVGNYYPFRDGRIDEIENGLTESVWVERQLGRPVVKVFNSIIAKALAEAGRPAGSRDRVALPISGDDPKAKEIVAQVIDRIGFDSVDAGTIADSWRQQPGSPVYCTNPTKEELQLWLKNVDRSSLATGREKGLKAYLAVVDADYQTQVKAHRSVLVEEI